MAIKIKYKYQELQALNEVWHYFDALYPTNAREKAMISVMQELAIKMQQKQVAFQYKYEHTKIYNTSLKAYEAYFLEMYLRDVIKLMEFGYSRTIVNKIADFLHQKLA